MSQALLEINSLSVSFLNGRSVLDDINMNIVPGEVVGLAGSSGSGKSVLCRSILRLEEKSIFSDNSSINFNHPTEGPIDLASAKENSIAQVRGKHIGMVFQEPKVALDPSATCGSQLMEVIIRHKEIETKEAKSLAMKCLEEMGLESRIFEAYPFQISGGEAQRVMIAIATVCGPKLLLADEPTTSLDAVVENQVVELLMNLRRAHNMAILLVSHDLDLLERVADKVIFIKEGKLVEKLPYSPTPAEITARQNDSGEEILVVKELRYRVNGSRSNEILKGINFETYRGEILGIVGNSGSGKTTLARNILKLIGVQSGTIQFKGAELHKLSFRQMKALRKEIQIVFQDPLDSLNPRKVIKETLLEPLKIHNTDSTQSERMASIMKIIDKVKLGEDSLLKYPHELSGGERQRVCIARALLLRPTLLVLDEPVTSLDQEIKGEILSLLIDLKNEFNLTYIFISHDLDLINFMTNRVIVLKEGAIVEEGVTREILENPKHDYTKSLVANTKPH